MLLSKNTNGIYFALNTYKKMMVKQKASLKQKKEDKS